MQERVERKKGVTYFQEQKIINMNKNTMKEKGKTIKIKTKILFLSYFNTEMLRKTITS